MTLTGDVTETSTAIALDSDGNVTTIGLFSLAGQLFLRISNHTQLELDQAVGIAYEGAPLEPSTTYYWKVTIWDKDANASTSEIHILKPAYSAWMGGNPLNGFRLVPRRNRSSRLITRWT